MHIQHTHQIKVICRNFRHTTPHGAMEGKTQGVNINNQ